MDEEKINTMENDNPEIAPEAVEATAPAESSVEEVAAETPMPDEAQADVNDTSATEEPATEGSSSRKRKRAAKKKASDAEPADAGSSAEAAAQPARGQAPVRTNYWAQNRLREDMREARENMQAQLSSDDIEWRTFRRNIRSRTPVNCTITGWIPRKLTNADGSEQIVPLVEAVCEPFTVLIPFSELWLQLPADVEKRKNESNDAYITRLSNIVSRMFGAKIDVIITSAQRAQESSMKYQIYGSRRQAMLAQIAAYFSSVDSNGNFAPVFQVDNQTPYKATIISCNYNTMTINFYGIDKNIRYQDATCRYVSDPRQMFKPGDSLYVTVQGISFENARTYRMIPNREALEAARSQFRPESAQFRDLSAQIAADRDVVVPDRFNVRISAHAYERGVMWEKNASRILALNSDFSNRNNPLLPRCRGIITAVVSNPSSNNRIYWLYLPDYDLVASAVNVDYGSGSKLPDVGDSVVVKITGYDAATRRHVFNANVVRYIGPAGDIEYT